MSANFHRERAAEHIERTKPDSVGDAVLFLAAMFPRCEITAIPVSFHGYHQGYRLRVTHRDAIDAFSFTIPSKRGRVYAMPLPDK